MRRAAVVLAALLAALVPAAPALADGDPASDTLLYADSFYPYQPNQVSKPVQKALDGMLREARRKGFGMKVAIIAAPSDLGSVPQLFSNPQPYADLLTKEITFNNTPRVLVVLPAGIGGDNLGDFAAKALSGLAPDPNGGSDGLARTAMTAVQRLTTANGTPVRAPAVAAAPATSSGKGGGGVSPAITFGLPVALVVLAAGAAALRGRSREPDEDDAAEPAE